MRRRVATGAPTNGARARRARSLDVRPEELPSWSDWLEGNERLVREGRTILGDPGTYGVHLDRMEGSRGTLRDTMSRMERFTPRWETLYDRLERDWNDLVAGADRAGLPLPLVHGYDELIGRVRDLAEHPRLPSTEQEELTGLLEYHRAETAARGAVHDYLEAAERHVETFKALEREAQERGIAIANHPRHAEWRKAARSLLAAGRAILADEETYGTYLDAVTIGKPRARLTVAQLRSRIEGGSVKAPKVEEPAPRREPAPGQQEGIAHILDDPEKLRELREKFEKRERRLGRHMRRSRGLSM